MYTPMIILKLISGEGNMKSIAIRILPIMLALMMATGCSIRYAYTPKKPYVDKPLFDKHLIVTRFKDYTDKKYSKNLNSVINPIGSLSLAFSNTIRDRGIFSKVTYVDEEYQFDRIPALKRKYGNFDAVFTGSVRAYKWNDYPYITSFLPPLWIGAAVGIPLLHGGHELTIAYSVEMLNPGNESLIWSNHLDKRFQVTRWGSFYMNIEAKYCESLTWHIDKAINETMIKLQIQSEQVLANFDKTKTVTPVPVLYSQAPPPRMQGDKIQNSWCVVVGISTYQYSGKDTFDNLIFADDDARAFAKTLHGLGWADDHIKLLTNQEATQRNIMIALESWLTKAGPDDQIVLFWSGHGYPDPEDPEKVYFACYDTDIRIPATGYRMDRVRTALEESNAKHVILLADTCHAGKLITRGDKGLSIVPQINKMNREKKIPKGWIFMVGADTDRQAIEHTSWTNGAFTHSLIKGLSGEADGFQSAGAKDGIITMGELKDYMNVSMPSETQTVLGVAKRPVITTSTGDPGIWNMSFQSGL